MPSSSSSSPVPPVAFAPLTSADAAGVPDLRWPGLEAVPDVRLVVADMDGTLLDADHAIDPLFWPLLRELGRRGIMVCPASGRPYATLARDFGGRGDNLVYIAENGAHVVHGEVELSSSVLDAPDVTRFVEVVRDLTTTGVDAGIVLCGRDTAYVERTDAHFLAQLEPYFATLTPVADARRVDAEIVKVSVYDFGSAAQTSAPAFAAFDSSHRVVVSQLHWLDIFDAGTDKGTALRRVQDALSVTRAQTMVFGDYLNDVEMLDAADLSFAMANSHPQVLERARYLAPPNTENGVVRSVAAVLGISLAELAADLPAELAPDL